MVRPGPSGSGLLTCGAAIDWLMAVMPPFPNALSKQSGFLGPLLMTFAQDRGADSKRMRTVIPECLYNQTADLDAISNSWKYAFGSSFDVGNGQIAVTYPNVEHLYIGLQSACRHLTDDQIQLFKARLCNREKHQDALAELLAVARVPATATASYEEEGSGVDGKLVDWLIRLRGGVEVAMEVKNRVVDTIRGLESVAAGALAEDGSALAPSHSFDDLLRGIADKFPNRGSGPRIHGGWVRTHLKQTREDVLATFNGAGAARFDFLVLGSGDGDATVLAKTEAVEKVVLSALGFEHTDRFLYG